MSGQRPRVLLIDHYDSFTHNLAQQVWVAGADCVVRAHDQLSMAELSEAYTHFILSPGPGHPAKPEDFSISAQLLKRLRDEPFAQPLLGVCLGHQGLALALGGQVKRAPVVMHGKESLVSHNSRGLFEGLPSPLRVMRYHSLCVDELSLPPCLEVTAKSDDDQVVMALQHRSLSVYSVQFHPESVGTPRGSELIERFLSSAPSPYCAAL
jgi:anthranilate synthase component 2